MGFEITYFYKEADEFPGVYKEEILSKTSKVGKFEEDVPLENLAGKIIAQLARRNILIVDIEIYEYTKKKISYKQTDTGISIRNKKFNFEAGAVVSSDSEDDEELSRILENEELVDKIKKVLSPSCSNSNSNVATKPLNSKRVLRYEIYEPELLTKSKIEQRGYKFTVGKKYPIYSEIKKGIVINYITKDDTGREVEVGSDCFVIPPVGLSFNDESPQYYGAQNSEFDLWKNIKTEEVMPDIRR
jgi:hypothetical protein